MSETMQGNNDNTDSKDEAVEEISKDGPDTLVEKHEAANEESDAQKENLTTKKKKKRQKNKNTQLNMQATTLRLKI